MMNRANKTILGDVEAPSRNDEYLFYQVLLGAWPAGGCAPTDELRRRFKSYMLKAAREAKELTSWANQNAEYENALTSFVDEVLNSDANQEFLSDFMALQHDIARAGMFNTLSQTLIKLTAPGVPDIYQGNDLCEFQLVDPDNRSPVDYSRRKQLLSALTSLPCSEHANLARALTAQLLKGEDFEGQAKLFVTWKALRARQHYRDIFEQGEYVPLTVEGPRSANVVAFARESGHSRAVIAVPRMCARFLEGESCKLCSRSWQDTRVKLPATGTTSYRNIMTGEELLTTRGAGEGSFLDVSALMKDFLWTVLVAEEPTGTR
jgi:(1->4)-alpha-D-glucan 1-alpha-D-glucosylmutase